MADNAVQMILELQAAHEQARAALVQQAEVERRMSEEAMQLAQQQLLDASELHSAELSLRMSTEDLLGKSRCSTDWGCV